MADQRDVTPADNEPTQAIDPVRPGTTARHGAPDAATGHGATSDNLTSARDAGATRASDEATRVMPAVTPVVDEDEARARREREARAERDARLQREEEDRQRRALAEQERQRRLGQVTPADEPDPVVPTLRQRTTDKFFASFGLFMLRLVTAAVIGVHGFNQLVNIDSTKASVARTGLPYATYLAWGMGVGSVLAAVLLVFGFLVRVAGLAVLAGAVAILVFVMWGSFRIMHDFGFFGERELLLAGIGLLLLCLGGGGWGLDAGFRRNRARNRGV